MSILAVRRYFYPQPTAAGEARRFVANMLPDAPCLDDLVLVASELAAMVIEDPETPFGLSLSSRADEIRMELSVGGSGGRLAEDPNEEELGVQIMDAVAQRWGVQRTDHCRTIWIAFPTATDTARR